MSVGLGVMVWGLLSLGVLGTPATAAPVTFQFAGQLTSVIGGGLTAAGFSAGQSFVGSYTFESSSSDRFSSANLGDYRALTNLTATIGSYTVTLVPGIQQSAIAIWNNYESYPNGPRDMYSVGGEVTGAAVNGVSPFSFGIDLTDPSHTAFDSDALPSSPPNLSSFATKRASFYFPGALGNSFLHGEIHSLTAVPIPAAVLLFGTGLTALIGLGAGSRRRKLTRVA